MVTRIFAKLRGRWGQAGIEATVSTFKAAHDRLHKSEQHLIAEAESNANKVDAILKRDAQIAKDRLRALRLKQKLSEFI